MQLMKSDFLSLKSLKKQKQNKIIDLLLGTHYVPGIQKHIKQHLALKELRDAGKETAEWLPVDKALGPGTSRRGSLFLGQPRSQKENI